MENNGFSSVTVRGVPLIQQYPGRVWWVQNSSNLPEGSAPGSDSGNEGTYTKPFATIDYAIGNCVASRGDIIAVMPGYTQTITLATQLVMDVAGIAIVGLGSGSLRPTLTFGAVAGNIPITAANMCVTNILHVNNFADITSNYTATGTAAPTNLAIENCEFRDTSNILNSLTTLSGNATANSLDGLSYCRNRVWSLGTTAATYSITLLEDADRVTINDNVTVHAILNDKPGLIECTSKNLTNLQLDRNIGFRPNTSSTNGSFVGSPGTSCTGMCQGNRFSQRDTAGAAEWIKANSDLGFAENFSHEDYVADTSAKLWPAAA